MHQVNTVSEHNYNYIIQCTLRVLVFVSTGFLLYVLSNIIPIIKQTLKLLNQFSEHFYHLLF